MERATGESSVRRWVRGTAYRRVSPPRWPFVFRGLLSLLGLLAVVLFGVTRFADHWIERQVRENVRSALDGAGHEWAQLTVSGQRVLMSGTPLWLSAADSALAVARAATCPTWLGPKTCAVTVSGVFSAEQPGASWPDLRGAVDRGMLTLTGEVPDESVRGRVLEAGQAGAERGRLTAVHDRLTVTGGSAPAEFGALASRVAEVASMCAQGEARLVGGTLSVRCLVARALEADIRALIRPLTGARLGEVSLVVAEDAAACERDLAALQRGGRIQFASGSATIVPAAAVLLDQIGQAADACPGILRIEGHTDSAGDADANQALSAARAQAVRDALIGRGVPAERLAAAGYGSRVPVASNDTPEGRARNRRIEFRVTLDTIQGR